MDRQTDGWMDGFVVAYAALAKLALRRAVKIVQCSQSTIHYRCKVTKPKNVAAVSAFTSRVSAMC